MDQGRIMNQQGPQIGRRLFLRGMAAAVSLGAMTSVLPRSRGRSGEKLEGKLIVRQSEPLNLEFPFTSLNSLVTPNDLFYVRNHCPMPRIDPKTWRLKVTGTVRRPLELTYEEVTTLPSLTRTITLECAGNGRAFLNPKTKGVQWQLGAVGTATWTGFPLRRLLDRAGLEPQAVEVILEGADQGQPTSEPVPPGAIHFARSLPLAKALSEDVLLAHRMNDEVLSQTHGFPLRAVVGGWYGMASIKWLTNIVVTDKPFVGYEQSVDYAIWRRNAGLVSLEPIRAMQVKASIARPETHESILAGAVYRIFGAAWAGETDVAKVEISTDAGQSWKAAKLLGTPVPLAWRLWEYHWRSPQSGQHTLMARATDVDGNVQPMTRDPDLRNYMINHVLPVEVTVRG
jgi:DMSO/TMAO reductase YedYZ molybdopterin-dependent catalytic subunit